MKISGAKIVVETLIEQGCDTVFGYPGGQVINLFDELYLSRDRIKHVLTAHEQGASMPPTATQEPREKSVWLSPLRVRGLQIS